MRRFLCISAVAMMVAMPVYAAEEDNFSLATARDLGALCAATSNPSAIHMCHGYLIGVHHMHVALSAGTGAGIYCVPDDGTVTRDTAAAAFTDWISQNSAAAHLPAREGLLEWARLTFPCN